MIVAGNAAARLKTGRHIPFVPGQAKPVNNLLATLATVCGVPTTTFGDPTFATGAYQGIT